MKNNLRQKIFLLLFSSVALAIIFVMWTVGGTRSLASPSDLTNHDSRRGNGPDRVLARHESSNDERSSVAKKERRKSLEDFKRRWLSLGSGSQLTPEDYKNREELALLCCKTFLFSEEIFELEAFLKVNGISIEKGNGALADFLIDLRNGESEVALRRSFLRYSGSHSKRDLNSPPTEMDSRMNKFSALIGGACRDDEFLSFHQELESINPVLAKEAFLGHSEESVAQDPSKVLKVLNSIAEGQARAGSASAPAQKMEGFFKSVVQHVKNVNDFPEIDAVIDKMESSGNFKPETVRQELIFRWANQDLEAASNHVLKNPEKYPVKLLEYVATGGFGVMASRQGEEAAMQWLQSLPEGVARNSAVYGAARQVYQDDLQQAKRIASLMDPNERAVIFKRLPYINE